MTRTQRNLGLFSAAHYLLAAFAAFYSLESLSLISSGRAFRELKFISVGVGFNGGSQQPVTVPGAAAPDSVENTAESTTYVIVSPASEDQGDQADYAVDFSRTRHPGSDLDFEVPPESAGRFFFVFGGLMTLIFLSFAGSAFLAARMMARQSQYGVCLLAAAFECLFFPAGTVLGLTTLLYLSRKQTRQLFAGPSDGPSAAVPVSTLGDRD